MSRLDRERWNAKHREQPPPPPNPNLVRLVNRFPRGGRILDIACGLGSNSVFLAHHLAAHVDALDCSEIALAGLQSRAERSAAPGTISPIHADLDRPPLRLASGRYDAIVVISFLDRTLFRELTGLLAPSGLLFCETFDRRHLERVPSFPPHFLIGDDEFPATFPDLTVVVHESCDGRTTYLGRRSKSQ